MQTLWQDLRYGVRVLRARPAFSAIAIMILALGIGANTAIFSVVNAVLLRPLPYKEAERIVLLWGRNVQLNLNQTEFPASYPDFDDWREQARAFDHISALLPGSLNLSDDTEPERIGGIGVTADFFKILGVEAMMGRTFSNEEAEPGREHVVLLSHSFWQRRFGADASVIDRTITLNGRKHRIIGIMPAGFRFAENMDMPPSLGFPSQVDLWTPLALRDSEIRQRGNRMLVVIGRLKSDVSLAQAQGEMNSINASLGQRYPNTNEGLTVEVVPLREQFVGRVRPALLILFAAVAFVLLIACANVANLMLARAATRRKEIAVRLALGASRWRIVRQLLTEGLLLSLLGGLAGLLLSLWGMDVLLAATPANLPRMAEAGLDYRLIGFALLLSLLTGMIFSLVPALQASNPNLNESLKEGGRSTTEGGQRLRGLLVIAEVALTLVLLVGAGLMIRSFIRLQQVDIGFNPQNILTMQINLPLEQYAGSRDWSDFFDRLIERVEALPGVESAAVTQYLPVSGTEGSVGFQILGQEVDPNAVTSAGIRRVSPGYFRTLGVPLLRGRDFTKQDAQDRKAIIINEAMARRFWPGRDPIGQQMNLFGNVREIAGIAKDVKYSSPDKEADPAFYQPVNLWFMNMVARTSVEPGSLIAAVRNEVQALDKNLPVANVATMEQILSTSVAERQFNMLLLGIFAVVAFVMAMVGIYGVMSYMVTQNTREIGIRMALGARPGNILKLVVGQGMILTLSGLGVGVPAAYALTRFLESLLFNVSPTDPITFAGVSLLLAAVALLACYIPARRAARVDPMVALRYE
ncbi:MAG: ABC transporter permease [Blastocatellia bacterium]|nr:ABC transporter permease [Blastocatellia bacterium]